MTLTGRPGSRPNNHPLVSRSSANRMRNTPKLKFLGWLICAFSSVAAESQFAEETSVAEPTQLYTAASEDNSELVRSEVLGKIESTDARAAFSAIEVEAADGERVRGVKIALENSSSTDQIYITESLLASLRNELEELEVTSLYDGECQAKYRCVHGISRCRPSQTERQAYCPGRYSTPSSEKGFTLSTPRHSFFFPSIGTAQIDALISEAVQVLE